MKETNLLIKKF